MDKIEKRILELENSIQRITFGQKKILNHKEAALYLSISDSYLHKLRKASKVAYYQPNGKLIYFKREDLDSYMMQNRHRDISELKAEVYSNGKL